MSAAYVLAGPLAPECSFVIELPVSTHLGFLEAMQRTPTSGFHLGILSIQKVYFFFLVPWNFCFAIVKYVEKPLGQHGCHLCYCAARLSHTRTERSFGNHEYCTYLSLSTIELWENLGDIMYSKSSIMRLIIWETYQNQAELSRISGMGTVWILCFTRS